MTTLTDSLIQKAAQYPPDPEGDVTVDINYLVSLVVKECASLVVDGAVLLQHFGLPAKVEYPASLYPILCIGDEVQIIKKGRSPQKGDGIITDSAVHQDCVEYTVDGSGWYSRDQLILVNPVRSEKQHAAVINLVARIEEEEYSEDDDDEDSDDEVCDD
jgi:hypothetical protein